MRNSDLFHQENSINEVPASGYANVEYYIEVAKAISRTTYKSIYIVDYYKKNLLYSSSNQLFMCKNAVNDVVKTNSIFNIERVALQDREFVLKASEVASNFIHAQPEADRTKYRISCNFHIADSRTSNKTLINLQMTPMKLNDDGKIWLALCVVSLAPGRGGGNIIIQKEANNWVWKFDMKIDQWVKADDIELSESERLVIALSHQGLSMKDIGQEMSKSIDTIKSYRKRIFLKLGVDNINEAIACTMLYQLL